MVETVRQLVGRRPVYGICLGHQLLCRAVGLETYKLPFGHHGANHPVKDLTTGRIEITSQNHGFAVLGPSGQRTIERDEPVRWETDFGAAELTHINLYDRTVEGLRLLDVPGATVQYHPEAGPGPHDSLYLFDRFVTRSRQRPPDMPRRDDIHKILLIGSGPIVIGQAAEFDYSGTQACKVLMEEGYEVVLVNSNPATIMTDPEVATATYIEPLLPGPVTQVIERERPDALLPTLGGQTALNLAKALHEDGTLERYGVELIGADYEAIDRAEDRERFRETMTEAGLRVPRSAIAHGVDDARAAVEELGLPIIVRPAFTLGGRGGGVVRHEGELETIVGRGIAASPIGQVLLEESVLGWGEFELEVMRDTADNVVIVCSIENLDPMGVHTGDSVCVAPQQTLTDKQYQALRDQAITVIRAVGVETGGSNVQFAVNPLTDEIMVIEMNPRVSPVERAGQQGDRVPDRQDRRPARGRLHPAGDPQRHHAGDAGQLRAHDRLLRGQVAAVRVREVPRRRGGADHSHEVGRRGDGDRPDVPAGVRQGAALTRARPHARARPTIDEELFAVLEAPGAERFDHLLEALRRGVDLDELHRRTRIDPWFLRELSALATDPDAAVRRRADLQGGRHLRRGVRRQHAVLLLGLGARARRRSGPRDRPRDAPERGHPGLGTEPDRAGDRVRLLLRARRPDRARVRP